MLLTLQVDNVQSIQSDLGGGANGHYGLVCTMEAYLATVPTVDLIFAVGPIYPVLSTIN